MSLQAFQQADIDFHPKAILSLPAESFYLCLSVCILLFYGL